MRKQIIFLASPAHAGTTLVELIIGSHKDCFSLGEFHNVVDPNVWGKVPSCSVCGYDCTFWANFAYNRTRMPLHHAVFESAPSNTTVLTDSSKPIHWIRHSIKQFGRDMDWKVINLIRNPYGSLAHIRTQSNMPINRNNVSFWIQRVTNQIQFANAMPDHVYTIKYEDFCTNPDMWLKQICDFIGIDYHEEMKRFWKKHHHIHSGNSTPITMIQTFHGIDFRHDPPLRSRHVEAIEEFMRWCQYDFSPEEIGYEIKLDERYKTVLTEQDKRIITQMTLPWLKRFGYTIEG